MNKFKIRDITVIAVSAVILIASKEALKFLPNIELVSLLVLLYTQSFKSRTLYIIYIFVLVEGLMYGFGIWFITYLYVWSLLYFIIRVIGKLESALAWAIVLAVYGLLFGALCSIPYFFTLGTAGAFAWIVSGFMFDLMHCAGNFALTLILYKPLSGALKKITSSYSKAENSI